MHGWLTEHSQHGTQRGGGGREGVKSQKTLGSIKTFLKKKKKNTSPNVSKKKNGEEMYNYRELLYI